MKIRAPKHFSKEARKIWRDILSEYQIEDTAGIKILTVSLEAYDRAQQARELIQKHGMLLSDRFNQAKPNPAIVVERDARAAFLSGIKALNLDLEPLRDKPGRPGGR